MADSQFTGAPERRTFSGLLFDLDGTIVDTTKGVIKLWDGIGKDMGVPVEQILSTSHGRRTIDVIREYDSSRANWEYVAQAELRLPNEFASLVSLIDGSRQALKDATAAQVPWAVVTSGTRPLATSWFALYGLDTPLHWVTAEDVANGKPDPEGYRLGTKHLFPSAQPGHSPRLLVFEDAPAGVKAGKAAGHAVVGIVSTHTPDELVRAGADWVVKDLHSVKIVGKAASSADSVCGADTFELEIRNKWVPSNA